MDDRTPARPPQAAEVASAPLFLRIGDVMRLTGLGRSTIYRLMAAGEFPQPVRLTRRLVAWRRADVERWCDGRPEVTHETRGNARVYTVRTQAPGESRSALLLKARRMTAAAERRLNELPP